MVSLGEESHGDGFHRGGGGRIPIHVTHDLQVIVETGGRPDHGEDQWQPELVLGGGPEDEEFAEETNRERHAGEGGHGHDQAQRPERASVGAGH